MRVHLERLVELEYLAIRHGRLGSPFVYEWLLDLDAPEAVAHVGLIDVEQLKRMATTRNLAGLSRGWRGKTGTWRGVAKPPRHRQTLPASRFTRNLTAWRNRASGRHRRKSHCNRMASTRKGFAEPRTARPTRQREARRPGPAARPF